MVETQIVKASQAEQISHNKDHKVSKPVTPTVVLCGKCMSEEVMEISNYLKSSLTTISLNN